MHALQSLPHIRGAIARQASGMAATAHDSMTRRRHLGRALIAQLRAGTLAPNAVAALLEEQDRAVNWLANSSLPQRPQMKANCAPSEISDASARQHMAAWISALLKGGWATSDAVTQGIADGDDAVLQVLREGWWRMLNGVSEEVVALVPPLTDAVPIYAACPSAWYADEGQRTVAMVLELESTPVIALEIEGAPDGTWHALELVLGRANKRLAYLHISHPIDALCDADPSTQEAFEDVWLAMEKTPDGAALTDAAIEAYCGLVGADIEDVPTEALQTYIQWRRKRKRERAGFPRDLESWFQQHGENPCARKLQALDAFASRLPTSTREAELDWGGQEAWDTYFPTAGVVDCASGLWDHVADGIDEAYGNASRTWVAVTPIKGACVAAASRRALLEALFLTHFLEAVRDLCTPA